MIIILCPGSSGRNHDRPFDCEKLAATIECMFHGMRPWGRNNIIGDDRWHNGVSGSIVFGLHIVFSHDSVIGLSGIVGGSLSVFYLHLLNDWRVGHNHILFKNDWSTGRGVASLSSPLSSYFSSSADAAGMSSQVLASDSEADAEGVAS